MKQTTPYLLGAAITMGLCYSTTSFAGDSATVNYDRAEAEKIRHRHESTGLLSGMVLGGLAGGPGGAIIGAVGGTLFAGHLNSEQEREQLLATLGSTEAAYARLAREKRDLEDKYEIAMEELQNSRLQTVSLSGDTDSVLLGDTSMVIHFRTNSTTIEPHYREQLATFANMAKAQPDVVVRLTGFSDERGDDQNNLTLSRQRVASVEKLLDSLGLNTTVQTVAYGESRPVSAGDSLEGYFYDRRVEITLYNSKGELLTNADN